MRIVYGLEPDLLWMTGLDLPGPVSKLSRSQMIALKAEGFTRPTDLMKGDEASDERRQRALGGLEAMFKSLSNRIRDAARSWKSKDRKHCLEMHLRRADKVGLRSEIEQLYRIRGGDLEKVIEQILTKIHIEFELTDRPGTQGRPDYILRISDLPEIVVEVKTRESDSDLVGLNGATEVLTASELMGLRDAPCLTVCSPGADPSVANVIEGCGRLTVVDVCDLAEALIKVAEKSLTHGGLYAWLTAPGIALMEDIPHGD